MGNKDQKIPGDVNVPDLNSCKSPSEKKPVVRILIHFRKFFES